jgi:hypothetical protein
VASSNVGDWLLSCLTSDSCAGFRCELIATIYSCLFVAGAVLNDEYRNSFFLVLPALTWPLVRVPPRWNGGDVKKKYFLRQKKLRCLVKHQVKLKQNKKIIIDAGNLYMQLFRCLLMWGCGQFHDSNACKKKASGADRLTSAPERCFQK